jgi:hypothetical protein
VGASRERCQSRRGVGTPRGRRRDRRCSRVRARGWIEITYSVCGVPIAGEGDGDEREVVAKKTWFVGLWVGVVKTNGCASLQKQCFMCDFLTKPPSFWPRSPNFHVDEHPLTPIIDVVQYWVTSRAFEKPHCRRQHRHHTAPEPESWVGVDDTRQLATANRVPCCCLWTPVGGARVVRM